jgi:hypothetical protein
MDKNTELFFSIDTTDISVMNIRTQDYGLRAIAPSSLERNRRKLFTLKYLKSISDRTLIYALKAFSPFINMSRFRFVLCAIAWLSR